MQLQARDICITRCFHCRFPTSQSKSRAGEKRLSHTQKFKHVLSFFPVAFIYNFLINCCGVYLESANQYNLSPTSSWHTSPYICRRYRNSPSSLTTSTTHTCHLLVCFTFSLFWSAHTQFWDKIRWFTSNKSWQPLS